MKTKLALNTAGGTQPLLATFRGDIDQFASLALELVPLAEEIHCL